MQLHTRLNHAHVPHVIFAKSTESFHCCKYIGYIRGWALSVKKKFPISKMFWNYSIFSPYQDTSRTKIFLESINNVRILTQESIFLQHSVLTFLYKLATNQITASKELELISVHPDSGSLSTMICMFGSLRVSV